MTVELNNESDIEIGEERLLRLAEHILVQTHVNPKTDVSIIFVNEDAMEGLHEQWMNEPGTTDVLSFPMDELRPGRPDSVTPAGILGDIVVCPQVAQTQAAAAGHSLADEVAVLVTHGMLHLLGFDHATPIEEAEMFGLQRELLMSFNSVESQP
ncbi:MAG: rRNA maturation RNase YbeY [Canibacter sp.]